MNKNLTSRPSDMDYEAYRIERAVQKKQIKNYLRNGRLVYKSIENIVKDHMVVGIRKYPPFKGNTNNLKPI